MSKLFRFAGCAALAAIQCLPPLGAFAADSTGGSGQTNPTTEISTPNADTAQKAYQLDSSVPSSPALAILGATPSTAVGLPFQSDLTFDVVPNSGGAPSGAVTVRPYWLWGPGRTLPLGAFKDVVGDQVRSYDDLNWFQRALALSSISLAAGQKGTGATAPLGLSIAGEVELKGYDPRGDMDLRNCITAALGTTGAAPGDLTPPASQSGAGDGRAPPPGPAPAPAPKLDPLARTKLSSFLLARIASKTGDDDDALADATSDVVAKLSAASDEHLRDTFDTLYAQYVLAVQQPTQATQGVGDKRYEKLALLPAAAPAAQIQAPAAPPVAKSPVPKPATTAAKVSYATARTACLAPAQMRAAWQDTLTVGAGTVGLSQKRRFSDLRYAGTDVWAAYTLPLGSGAQWCKKKEGEDIRMTNPGNDEANHDQYCHKPFGQLSPFARYIYDDKVVQNATTTLAAHTAIGGLSFTKASNDGQWSFSVADAHYWRNFDKSGVTDESFDLVSAELDWKLSTWANIGLSGGTVTRHAIGEGDFGIAKLTLIPGGH